MAKQKKAEAPEISEINANQAAACKISSAIKQIDAQTASIFGAKYKLTPPLAEYDAQGFCVNEGFSLIYQCDHSTGEYTGATWINRVIGVGLPADAFLDAPDLEQCAENSAIVRAADGKSWTYLTDLRGLDSYHKQTQQLEKINYLGVVKDGYTLKKPASIYDVFIEDDTGGAWIFDKAKEKAALIDAAKAEKTKRLKIAEEQIEHLGDLIADDEADDFEKALSKEWRSYRAALRKIKPDEIEDYHNVKFPDAPQRAFDNGDNGDN